MIWPREVGMLVLVLGLKDTIYANPGRDPKSLMTWCPLFFLREGVHIKKQTKQINWQIPFRLECLASYKEYWIKDPI